MRRAVALAAVLGLTSGSALAAAYTISPDRDSYLEQGNAYANHGGASELTARTTRSESFRPIFHFDLSSIPENATIDSASVRLFATSKDDSGRPLRVYRVTDSWTESGVTWSNSAFDYDPTVVASFYASRDRSYVSFDVTDLVQSWICGTEANDGIVVRSGSSAESRFASREWSNSSQRPLLTVTTSSSSGGCPGSTPDHFSISHDGSANDCLAESITITAQDASDATQSAYSGSVTLTTSTGHGDWQVGAGGAQGTLTPGASDSGSATYAFVAADGGQVVLELLDPHDETLNIDVADGAIGESASSDPDLTVAGCTIPGGVSCSVWFDSAWLYRKALIVDSGQVRATLTDFPLLVSISDDADLAAAARSDGFDILFTDADGTTQLDHEIESWDAATGTLVAWVRVPTLAGSGDPVVYLYYGNASAGDQSNASGVWDSRYAEVLHLHDDLRDSTSNSHDATNVGTSDAAGRIADGQEFNGSGSYIVPSVTTEGQSEITLSFWADADETVSDNGLYMELYDNNWFEFSINQNWFYTRDSSTSPTGGRENDVRWGPLTTGWHYLTFRYSVSDSVKAVYVDGVLDASSSYSIDAIQTAQDSDRIGSDMVTTDFDGTMDEFRLSLGLARSADWIATEYDNQRDPSGFTTMSTEISRCGSGPDHFAIDHDGAGINCQTEPVTISAHDESDAVDTSYSDTISISTTTSHGDWTLISGAGSLVDSGGGAATYSFAASDDGQVILGLRDTFAETTNIDVTDGGVSEAPGEDADLSFAASGFVFLADSVPSAIGTQIGGKASNVAPGAQVLELQAVRTSDSTGTCESFLTNTVTIALAYECENPTTCTANAVSINGIDIAGNDNGASLSYTNVDLDFGDASDTTAAFTFSYPDVGQVQIHARLALSPSGETLVGSSNSFVVRPFAFDVSVSGNPAPADASGSVFTSAGSDFGASARAVLWSAADDADNDGVADGHDDSDPFDNVSLADNASALNFGREGEAIALGATLYAPSPGNDPGLAGDVTISSFTSGSGSTSSVYYDDVGIAELSSGVSDGDYLGIGASDTAQIAGRSGTVGRFVPYDLDVSANTPVFDEGCPMGAFTYMDQPFGFATAPVLSVTARSEQGSITRNYKGDYWKIDNASLANRTYSAASGTLDTTGLPSSASDPTIASNGDGTGTLTFSAGTGLSFTRGATPVAPFDAEIRLEIDVADEDGVAHAGNPASFGQASAGNGLAFTSDKRMRYGRLSLANAHGSELSDLDVPLRAEYFDGSTFVSNSDDACTSVQASALSLTKNPATIASAATIDNDPLLLGNAGLWLSPAGSGNDGTVDLVLDLSAATGADLEWLRFDWPGDGDSGGLPDEDPSCRATFGIYKGRDPIVYLREDY